MNLIIITGPPAVGKMTVGQALAEKTGYKLLHSHMTIELVLQLFDFENPSFWPIVRELRKVLIDGISQSNLNGLIFTFCWAFDKPEDKITLDAFSKQINSGDGQTFYVELKADLNERLLRNRHDHRLAHKPSKRNIENSEKNLLHLDDTRVFETSEEYPVPYPDSWLKIDNTHLSPDDVADMVIERFEFEAIMPAK